MRIIFLFTFLFITSVEAQDERFFHELYRGDFVENKKESVGKRYDFELSSPMYVVDLNEDGRQEGIVYQQKDGESWLSILDDQGGMISKFPLSVYGKDARPFRINWRTIGPAHRVLVLSFYEGNTHYLQFHGTARFYFLTVEKNDLKNMNIFQGPAFYEEMLDFKKNYYRRSYNLDFRDLNHDGIKDIVVRHNEIAYAYIYNGEGRWLAGR